MTELQLERILNKLDKIYNRLWWIASWLAYIFLFLYLNEVIL